MTSLEIILTGIIIILVLFIILLLKVFDNNISNISAKIIKLCASIDTISNIKHDSQKLESTYNCILRVINDLGYINSSVQTNKSNIIEIKRIVSDKANFGSNTSNKNKQYNPNKNKNNYRK